MKFSKIVNNGKNFNNADFYELKNQDGKIFWSTVEASKAGYSPSDLIAVFSELLLDELHGVYIPKEFVERFDLSEWVENIENYDDLYYKNPNNPHESEHYWGTWNLLLQEACFEKDGLQYRLVQDGCLFAQAVLELE